MIFDVIAERVRVAATHSVIIIKDDFSIFFILLFKRFSRLSLRVNYDLQGNHSLYHHTLLVVSAFL